MSGPGSLAIAQAVADIISPLSSAGIVVVDPLYFEDDQQEGYAKLLTPSGPAAVRGWLIAVQREDEPLFTPQGEQRTTYIGLTAMLSTTIVKGTGSSRQLFDTMIVDARDALSADRTLGISLAHTQVRHYGLHAPFGYVTRVLKEYRAHTMPGLLRVWWTFC